MEPKSIYNPLTIDKQKPMSKNGRPNIDKNVSWTLTVIRVSRRREGLDLGAILVPKSIRIDTQTDVEQILKNDAKMVEN